MIRSRCEMIHIENSPSWEIMHLLIKSCIFDIKGKKIYNLNMFETKRPQEFGLSRYYTIAEHIFCLSFNPIFCTLIVNIFTYD